MLKMKVAPNMLLIAKGQKMTPIMFMKINKLSVICVAYA